MRRTLAVLTLAGVLAGGAACGTDAKSTAAPTTSATSASPTPSPSADYTVDTKKVCGEIEKILDGDMKTFGEELGKMIVYKQAKNRTQADKAKAAAQKKLKEIATSIRETTAAAQDPRLRESGEESAKNVQATAANAEFFNKIDNIKDLDSLESEMSGWLVPLATFCA